MTQLIELIKIRKLLQLLVKWASEQRYAAEHDDKIVDVKA